MNNEKNKYNKWFAEDGKKFAETIGIQKGMNILEFGAGSGNFTAVFSQAAGKNGKIYAVESNHEKYPELRSKIKKHSLNNVEIYDTKGSIELKFDIGFDMITFYDVIHYFETKQRMSLYKTAFSLLKNDGILSLCPKHYSKDDMPRGGFGTLDEKGVKKELLLSGFVSKNDMLLELIHDNTFVTENIWNFVKK